MQIDIARKTAIVSKHPGATADQVKHFQEYFLNNNKPNRVIISAGINDLLYNKSSANTEEVVEKVIDIGNQAKAKGVRDRDIYVLGLYQVEGIDANRFNDILKQRCIELNFGYVHNLNIENDDLFDGLHVNNRVGTKKMKHNIMQCFTTYTYSN